MEHSGMSAMLATARLRLRPVSPEDEAVVVSVLNDLDVSGWLSVVPYPYTSADFHHFRSELAKPGETFAVLDAEGFAGIVRAGRELGYWLAPRCHGRGYATEAARAVLAHQFAHWGKGLAKELLTTGLQHGFNNFAWEQVTADAWFDNAASLALLRRAGFREVGQTVEMSKARQAETGLVHFVLSRAEWLARPRTGNA